MINDLVILTCIKGNHATSKNMQRMICSYIFFWKSLFFRLHKVKSYFLFPFLFFPHLLFWVGWWGFKGLEQDFAMKSLRGIVG